MKIKKINEMYSFKDEYEERVKKCLIDNGIEQENAIKIVDILLYGKVNVDTLIKSLQKVSELTASMYGIFK